MGRQSSATFDEHERPTAQRNRGDEAGAQADAEAEADVDPNATTRMKPFDLQQLVQKGSGTRPVVTSEQIDRYMKERTIVLEEGATAPADERPTEPAPEAEEATPETKTENAKAEDAKTDEADIRDRETIDALTLQRETLVIKPQPEAKTTTLPMGIEVPIDVDLSRLSMMPSPRPAAGRPVPFTARLGARLDQRQLTIAAGFLIAMISALLGFVAGRL